MPAALRRLITVPAFLTLAALSLVSAPLWVPALALYDLALRRNFAGLRCGAFFAYFCVCEALGILGAAGLWLRHGPWRGGSSERYLDGNYRLEWWWARMLYHGGRRIFGFEVTLEGEAAVRETPMLLFLRHASLADTILAATFVSTPHEVRFRYVLKRELLWDPCLDIVGNRLPNHFVDRDPDDSVTEVAAVARLAEGLGPGEGALIYPEGTRFTEAKRARVLERLRESGQHQAADRAEQFKHVLPPRPGGPLALMGRAPEVDVVFCAHTGFEGAGRLADMWHGSLIDARVRVSFWRVPAAEIPRDPDERREWLFGQWETLDHWLASPQPEAEGVHRGLILQPTYRVRDGRAVVQLYGRLESGAAFLVEDDRFRPYFFVPTAERALAEALGDLQVEEEPLRTLTGEPVLRVTATLPGDVPALREKLERSGGHALEADLRFPYRYLIDHGLRATVAIGGEPRETRTGLLCFHNPELRDAPCRVPLRLLSIDLETTPDASRIFSAALVGTDADEVHLVCTRPVEGAHVHAEERGLLEAVNARIGELDPDVILGWNVVDFDLRVWQQRCEDLRVKPDLGRAPGGTRFQQDLGFARGTRASIPGRVVLDGIPLVRDAVRLPDYRLETVAQEILGRGKLIDAETPDAAAEIERRFREDPEALVAYNREDARLVLDVLDHERLIELCVERSLLSGMPLDRVAASIASFDRLYLPELRRRGCVAPSVARERERVGVRGGALLDPQPGLFRDVAVFDWKSLYPSLMRTFQLDPLAHARAREGDIQAPNGARFARGEAILPDVIERFMAGREAAKQRGDRHADQAIKIMMNSLFGVLGATACRFFDPSVANAITSFGQQTLHWTRDAFVEAGVRVLYGDTDSVFVALGETGVAPARAAETLRERAQAAIDARIREEYGVDSRLELELEHVFERFFLPHVRGGREGSKKRYAGWLDGRLQLVGLEAVRRDWPAVAGRLQRGVLERVFTDRDVLPFVREVVQGVRSGELDAELVYVRRVRKASLDKYTATTPPHVQAARKLPGKVGRVVRYVVTATGPEPCIPGRALPGGIDYTHYEEKVLRPVAEAILAPLDLDFDEAAGNPTQLRLL